MATDPTTAYTGPAHAGLTKHFVHNPAPPAAKPDPYAPFKEAIKAGKVVQVEMGAGRWIDAKTLSWCCPPDEYRIKPEPDPYAALKAAQAQGKVIQGLTSDGRWINYAGEPMWLDPPDRYRIKPDAPTPEPADPMLFSKGSPAGVTLTIRKPATYIRATEGEGTASITFPYNIPPDPPSNAHKACAGLMRTWVDQQHWRR